MFYAFRVINNHHKFNQKFYNANSYTWIKNNLKNNHWSGKNHSKKSIQKMKEIHKNRRPSDACIKAAKKHNIGKIQTDYTKLKRANSLRKIYKIIEPNGIEVWTNNLNKYCMNNKLNYNNMQRVSCGVRKHYKKYICKKQIKEL